MGVECREFGHGGCRLAHELFGALEVAQALLAGICHHNNAGVELWLVLQEPLGGHEQRYQAGGVVSDARGVHVLLVLGERQLACVGEDHIGVSRKDRATGLGAITQDAHHVSGLVHGDVGGALLAEPIGNKIRAAALVAGRRANSTNRAQELERLLANLSGKLQCCAGLL